MARRKNKPRTSKSVEEKYVGKEPMQQDFTNDFLGLRHANYHYNYFYKKPIALKWIKKWAKENKDNEVLEACKIADINYMTPGFAFICRMKTRECTFSQETEAHFEKLRKRFIALKERHPMKTTSDEDKKKAARRKTLQAEANFTKAYDELDELQFYLIDNRRQLHFKAESLKSRHSLSKDDMNNLIKFWQGVVDEIHEAVFKKTPDLVESYSHIKNLKGYYTLMAEVLNDLIFTNGTKKKKVRKARTPKQKTSQEKVKGIKFSLEDKENKVRGVHPSEAVGKSAMWVWSAKHRRIMFFKSKDGGFEVKGASFDNIEKGVTKGLRKPEETLKAFTKGTSLQRTKAYNALTTKERELGGRFNAAYIILKVEG